MKSYGNLIRLNDRLARARAEWKAFAAYHCYQSHKLRMCFIYSRFIASEKEQTLASSNVHDGEKRKGSGNSRLLASVFKHVQTQTNIERKLVQESIYMHRDYKQATLRTNVRLSWINTQITEVRDLFKFLFKNTIPSCSAVKTPRNLPTLPLNQ